MRIMERISSHEEATEAVCDVVRNMKNRLEQSPSELNVSHSLSAPSSCVPLERGAEWASPGTENERLVQKEDKNPTFYSEPLTQSTEEPQQRFPASAVSLSVTSMHPLPEATTQSTLALEALPTSSPMDQIPAHEALHEHVETLQREKLETIGAPYPIPPPEKPIDEVELLRFGSCTDNNSSPLSRCSRLSSPLSELEAPPIAFSYDGPPGHRILHLRPTPEQWNDFPALLSFAQSLHAEQDGCFKIVLPEELQEPLPEKKSQQALANAYRIRQTNHRTFWQVATVPSDGTFSSSEPDAELSATPDECFKRLKKLFNKSIDKQLRHIRYRVDVPAWTAKQRLEAGVPERSPIHPLAGDKLDHTKAIIPGVHTPYVYESAQHFGATFQLHAEDFRLSSLNHLYKGRKIWVVVPSTAVDLAEEALNRKGRCSQFMRHRAEFFFPDKLQKMGIPYRIVDQRPGETIVILPDAYHEGFSTGYTLAEAKNYADSEWTSDTYQPCESSCQLATAIPEEYMRALGEGEARLDLCAGYNGHEDDDDEQPGNKQHEGGLQTKGESSSTGPPSGLALKRPMEVDISEEIIAKHPRLD